METILITYRKNLGPYQIIDETILFKLYNELHSTFGILQIIN
jgi:hypothetical protein